MGSSSLVKIEAKLSPGSVEEWLSVVKDGTMMRRRSDLVIKVKKHLSALGWSLFYTQKGNKRELRYKSRKGKVFASLATACKSLVDQNLINDVACSPSNLCSRSTLDASKRKKRKRKRFDTHESAPKEEKRRINLDVVVAKQQQGKKRKTASVWKRSSCEKAKEKKQKKDKCEKESLRLWRKDCGPESNCDMCCVCHLEGDLILCDGCPTSFHQACLGLSSPPEEDPWFCPRCCCEICGSVDSPENSKLMTCEQCQKRCYIKCLKEVPCIVSGWFCSTQCNRVFSSLQNLVGRKIAVGDGGDLVWTLTRAPKEHEHCNDEQKAKLNAAVEILHQVFEPSKDPFSGRDIVEELVFRRDGNSMVRGFYIVLIEKKNEPVTVATVRVEKDVAEIPLVATLPSSRRSGMCRVLMDELEKQMSQMGVYRLVLPAMQEVLATWTERFGFSVMESTERLKLVRHGTLDFLGTTMCQKFLPEGKMRRRFSRKVKLHRLL